jgi:hypothetical protein
MQATRGALRGHARSAAMLLVMACTLGGTVFVGTAVASTAYSAASAQPHPIPWTGWHGRPIERPHKPVDQGALTRASYPVGWSAGAVRYGSGYHRPGGSRRVREVQWRLRTLGYHTGPIDGLYGPLTRSAVQWFQIKHGLRPTGVVAATTLAGVQNPKALEPGDEAQAKQQKAPSSRPPRAEPTPQRTTAPVVDRTPSWVLPVVIALLAACLVTAGCVALLTGTLRRRQRPLVLPPEAISMENYYSEPLPDEAVLGYVRSPDLKRAAPHTTAIMDACEAHGWSLARVVRDSDRGHPHGSAQPGLSYALQQLRLGAASRLVVNELDQLAPSYRELRKLVGWFIRTGVVLTALDVDIDTSTEAGCRRARQHVDALGRERAPVFTERREAQLRS